MSRHGRFPDFLIVGTQKGGTTSMSRYLSQFPRIKIPRDEVHYYTFYYDTHSSEWYKKKVGTYKSNIRNCFLFGEKSPSYLYQYQKSAFRAYEDNEDYKIIILLREPVSRLCSQYKMNVLNGVESRTFSKASWNDSDYFSRGKYYEQVRKFVNIFGLENVYISTSEYFRDNKIETVNQVLNFLHIHSLFVPDVREKYVGGYPKYQSLINVNHVISLFERFVEDNPDLRILLWNSRSLVSKFNKSKVPVMSKYRIDDDIKSILKKSYSKHVFKLYGYLKDMGYDSVSSQIEKYWGYIE